MKEQTPIRVVEIEMYNTIHKNCREVWQGIGKDIDLNKASKDACKILNTKVLEALERDKKFYCDNVTISRLRNTKTNAEWRRLVMNRFFAKQK
jgi:hypothetical protein